MTRPYQGNEPSAELKIVKVPDSLYEDVRIEKVGLESNELLPYEIEKIVSFLDADSLVSMSILFADNPQFLEEALKGLYSHSSKGRKKTSPQLSRIELLMHGLSRKDIASIENVDVTTINQACLLMSKIIGRAEHSLKELLDSVVDANTDRRAEVHERLDDRRTKHLRVKRTVARRAIKAAKLKKSVKSEPIPEIDRLLDRNRIPLIDPGEVDLAQWRLYAACRSVSQDLFFHPDGERGPARERRSKLAKEVCERCVVVQQCLDGALQRRERHGVWGGLSEEELARALV